LRMRCIGLLLLACPVCPSAIDESGPFVILNNHEDQDFSTP